MTTTLELPDPLYLRAEQAASRRHVTLAALFTVAIQREVGIDAPVRRRMDVPPVKVEKVPALSNAGISTLFDEEDLTKGTP